MPTVLMLSASPLDQDRPRLEAVFRDIRHSLQRLRNREHWKIESKEAAAVDDLRRAMLDYRPSVVHFSGYGSGLGGLCFEDGSGNTLFADTAPFAKLFRHFKDDLKCDVLNACYSEIQASAIRNEIDYRIGMRSAVDDDSAAKFAVAFYDAFLQVLTTIQKICGWAQFWQTVWSQLLRLRVLFGCFGKCKAK